MLEQIKKQVNELVKKLSSKVSQESSSLTQSALPLEMQINEADMLYPLVELTAAKKRLDLVYASRHPFINFLVSRRKKLSVEDEKNLPKIVANLEIFLAQTNDEELLQVFFGYFASKQGLVLFRSSAISIRYFSRMLVKLINDKPRLMAAIEFLNQPEHLVEKSDYDQLIHQAFAE